MQESTHDFVKICARHLPITGPIYEFGSLDVHDDGRDENLKSHFKHKNLEYVGCDMREGPGVDQVQNLHALTLADNSVGTIVCMDTLEHVEFPRKAMSEMHRVLKPDGIAIMSSVFAFPIHGYPDDYWRFTPNGFKSLFKDFQACQIYYVGPSEINPRIVIGVGFKGEDTSSDVFKEKCANWMKWRCAIAAALTAKEKEQNNT